MKEALVSNVDMRGNFKNKAINACVAIAVVVRHFIVQALIMKMTIK